MGFLDKTTRPLAIARADAAKAALIYKHPDQNIPNGAQLTVDSDEVALFFRDGVRVGAIGPGRHTLDSANVPFLGALVNRFTGGNVFLAEVYFISTREHEFEIRDAPIGRFFDPTTRKYLTLSIAVARYTLRVLDASDPARLISGLGGQRDGADRAVREMIRDRVTTGITERLNDRMTNLQAGAVDLLTNQHSPAIGREVLRDAEGEFRAYGLVVARFLRLELAADAESMQAIEEYQARLAEQDLEMRKAAGMTRIAGSYAAYQIATGQGAALRGLGEGLAQGGGAAGMALGTSGLGMGIGMGASVAGLMGTSALPPATAPASAAPPALAPPRTAAPPAPAWYFQSDSGQEGPYVPRQVAQHIAQRGLDPAQVMVWAAGTPTWLPAASVPAIQLELRKRQGGASTDPTAAAAFEARMRAAIAAGTISDREVDELVALGLQAKIAFDATTCRRLIIGRAMSAGAVIGTPAPQAAPPQPPAPPQASAAATAGPPPLPAAAPPPLPVLFTYSDGAGQWPEQSAAAIAARVRAAPHATHLVWRAGMTAWLPAAEVEPIQALLAQAG